MSEYDAEAWWESLDWAEREWHRQKWRREDEEREIRRLMREARRRELFLCESLADALLAEGPGRLALHRKLALTCRTWAARVRAHYARTSTLKLYDVDATQGNASFVNFLLFTGSDGGGYKQLELSFETPPGLGDCTVDLGRWMDHKDLRVYKSKGETVKTKVWEADLLPKWEADQLPKLSLTATFFLGRAFALLPNASVFLKDHFGRQFFHPAPKLRVPEGYPLTDYSHVARGYTLLSLQALAGCARLAAKRVVERHIEFNNTYLNLGGIPLDDEGALWVHAQLAKHRRPDVKVRALAALNLDQTVTPLSLGLLGALAKRYYGEKQLDLSHLEELSVRGSHLREPAMKALTWTIARHDMDKLHTLDLCDAKIGLPGMRLLAPCLRQNLDKLRKLDLERNRLGWRALEEFKQYARSMRELETLNLARNRIHDQAEQDFFVWVAEDSYWDKIRKVHINDYVGCTNLMEKACAHARERGEWGAFRVKEGHFDYDSDPSNHGNDDEENTTEGGSDDGDDDDDDASGHSSNDDDGTDPGW